MIDLKIVWDIFSAVLNFYCFCQHLDSLKFQKKITYNRNEKNHLIPNQI